MAPDPKMSIELGSRSPDHSDTLLTPEVEDTLPWQRTGHTRFNKLRRVLAPQSRRWLHSGVGRLLIFTIIAWVAAYYYSKHRFWRDPESYFHTEDGVYNLEYSAQRKEVAWDYIRKWNESTEQVKEEMEPVMCVGMVTVKRKEKMDYLNATIGSMFGSLTDEERSALNVRLLFADLEYERHPNWDATWLNSIDHWAPYNLSDEKLEEIRGWPNLQTKGIFDYVYMIEQCLNYTTAPYIAIFEDDLIFAEGWLAKTINALYQIREQSTNWLYLRLFYVDRLGYDRHRDHWTANPKYWFYTSVAVAFTFTLLARFCWKRVYPNSNTALFLVLGCITIPVFLFLMYLIGKNSLLPREGLQRMDRKGCCTQALIYPRDQAIAVADMLRPKTKGQTDLEIEKWATAMDYARYAVCPQIVQHIGTISTRGLPKNLAKTTWAYFFEGYSAEKLHKVHMKLAKWGIWRARVPHDP